MKFYYWLEDMYIYDGPALFWLMVTTVVGMSAWTVQFAVFMESGSVHPALETAGVVGLFIAGAAIAALILGLLVFLAMTPFAWFIDRRQEKQAIRNVRAPY